MVKLSHLNKFFYEFRIFEDGISDYGDIGTCLPCLDDILGCFDTATYEKEGIGIVFYGLYDIRRDWVLCTAAGVEIEYFHAKKLASHCGSSGYVGFVVGHRNASAHVECRGKFA